jgi:5-oxopent-3-ene-1,2,5-tricarboxylate decarboxylase/2-hydroxyhepta-2,4-diene-1,7-dioate isomerase
MLTTSDDPVPVRGAVYGVALHAGMLAEADAAASAKSVPSFPVLFIKPANTFLANGGTVRLPSSMPEVEACPILAIVFGRDTRSASATEAFDGVAGYTLAIDLTEPGAGLFRPPIREKCRDGFLPIGPYVVAKDAIGSLDEIRVGFEVDGEEVSAFALGGTHALIAKLIEDVSAFMTFRAGDMLLAARAPLAARVRAGSRVAAVSEDLGRLECMLTLEEEVSA